LGTNASVFKSGQKVQFSCNEGFSATTCQATGWSPQPACNIVNCTVPPLKNGHYITSVRDRVIKNQEPYNTLISAMCNIGYINTSHTQRKCGSGGQWSGAEVDCTPITCERLPDTFDNGYYDSRDTPPPFPYNYSITVVCDYGYYLTQQSTQRCIALNTWNGTDPECRPITCRSPITFRHGHYNESRTRNQQPYGFGTILVPTCEPGHYMSNNVERRVCEGNDIWSGSKPECKTVTCETPTITHGQFTSPGYNDRLGRHSTFPYNHAITVVCDNGYYLTQSATRRCVAFNTWSETDPRCGRITCQSPTTFSNGQYNLSRQPYYFGTVLVPTCDTGYYMSNNVEKRVCEQLDTWSGTDPECRRITCRPPDQFSNGQYNGSRQLFTYKDILIPICNIGFRL